MILRFLVNADGSPFDEDELNDIKASLDGLSNDEREMFRNNNAKEIAEAPSDSILIVSGPGTGKSYIFLRRIEHWLKANPSDKIRVISFVRKLVTDLQEDVTNDSSLSEEQKNQITVSTLHKLARSILEKSHGTTERPLRAHFKIIVNLWEEEIWNDTKGLCGIKEDYPWKKEALEKLYRAESFTNEEWPRLIATFFGLCSYYNAICFADMVDLATSALIEKPELIEDSFFILDEYQDFNQSEENLVNELTKNAKGILMVGDDDQVLYEKLKQGKAELIRRHYSDTSKTNAMLPYCGRSVYHIAKVAAHFIEDDIDNACIRKIYLPLTVDEECQKVKCIACAQPSGAIDYIKKFISENHDAIEERKEKLKNGDKKDAFLLILSPNKKLSFYRNEKDELFDIITSYQEEQAQENSDDYYKVLTYYSFANDGGNNYAFRKMLFYEDTSRADIDFLLEKGFSEGINFIEIESETVNAITSKAVRIKEVLENDELSSQEKAQQISETIQISNVGGLAEDIEKSINDDGHFNSRHEDEEEAELEEIEPSRANAIELMSIVGSKGLSADHVIIVGFDNTNMAYITKNAFYVAMTRARESLHIITSLQANGASGVPDFFSKLPESHLQFLAHKKTKSTTTIFNSKQKFLDYFSNILYAISKSK